MNFKDLFSKQASDYARFRPRYPLALYDCLARQAPSLALAWDCGTGSGQAAVGLALHFDRVVATDPSPKQIANAEPHPRVSYAVGSASRCPLDPASCDLVTAAQAFHWFDQEAFYVEVRRVLKPGGVVAVWSYSLCEVTPQVDGIIAELYEDILGAFWEPERRQVEQGYSQARFPFDRLALSEFQMVEHWDVGRMLGFLGTWSALQAYVRQKGDDPLLRVAPRLRAAWGDTTVRPVRWPLSVLAGRV